MMIRITVYDAQKYLERYSVKFECDNPSIDWEDYWLVFGDDENMPPMTYSPEDAWNPSGDKINILELDSDGIKRILLQIKIDIDRVYYEFDDLPQEIRAAFGKVLAESLPQDEFLNMMNELLVGKFNGDIIY